MRKDKVVISKYILFFLFLLVPFFKPWYVTQVSLLNSLFSIWYILNLIIGMFIVAISIIEKKYRPSLVVILIACYLSFQLLATYKNGGAISIDFTLLVKYTGLSLLLDHGIQQQPQKAIKASVILFSCLLIVNAMSVFIFPNGLSVSAEYGYPYWFWTLAGHFSSLVFSCTILLAIYTCQYEKKYKLLMWFIILLYMFFFIFKFWDMGNAIGFIIIVLPILLYVKNDKIPRIFNSVTFLIAILCLHIGIVILRVQNLFAFFITNIMHKDLTFTGRTMVWDSALLNIANNFWYGLGTPSAFGFAGWSFLSGYYIIAHNQFLDVFQNGGVFTFAIYCAIFIYITYELWKYREFKVASHFAFGLLGFGVTMLSDSLSPYEPLFVLLTFAANVKFYINTNIYDKSKSHRFFFGGENGQ